MLAGERETFACFDIGKRLALARQLDLHGSLSLPRSLSTRSDGSPSTAYGRLPLIEGESHASWSAANDRSLFVSEDESDMRGIKHGWYAIEDDGDLSCVEG